MFRLFSTPILLGLTLMLAGCLPAPSPEGSTPAPETSSPSPSAPSPSPAAITLPTCAELYTPAQVGLLIGADLELIGDATHPESDGGFGTSIPELVTQLRDGGAINCTWVLPATERGLTVSYLVITADQRDSIVAALTSAGAGTTPIGGDFAIHGFRSDGEYPFTEAHGLGGELWVSAHDGFGENAPALVQDALDRIITLNPGRF